MTHSVQPALSFNPYRGYDGARARGCYTCEHWKGAFYSAHLLCERDLPFRYVPSIPLQGCVFWMRATGADDA